MCVPIIVVPLSFLGPQIKAGNIAETLFLAFLEV